MTDAAVPAGASGPWPAPAKLNLCLHITARRADGYHLLQTVFQFINQSDTLYFLPRADGLIRRVGGALGVTESADLVVRAARLLQQESACAQGVDIYLHKRLPMGGGLGGGSSDAATTLRVLDRLWGLDLGVERLAGLGLALGADVPVFVRGHAAWAEGVGEQLSPLDLPEPWFLVLTPPVTVSTAEVFSDEELTRNTPQTTISDFLSAGGHNDCEAVVRRRYPQVGEALDWLGGHAPARLTGTGGCVFAAFDDESAANAVLRQAPGQWQGFVARACNVSPLERALQQHGQQ